MTCKNCLHFDVCKSRISQFDEDLAKQIDWNINDAEMCECGQGFADKELYIKLPCKVGDIVWCCTTPFSIDKGIVTSIETSIIAQKTIITVVVKLDNKWIDEWKCIYGVNAFSTYEEAEKAFTK